MKFHVDVPKNLVRAGETFEFHGKRYRIVAVRFDRTALDGYWAVLQ